MTRWGTREWRRLLDAKIDILVSDIRVSDQAIPYG